MLLPLPLLAPLTTDCVTVQAKLAPPTFEFRLSDVAFPEQMVCDAGLDDPVTAGNTVMVTVCVEPLQPFALGVTV